MSEYNKINIEGIDGALKTLEDYPKKINTVTKAAMRKAIAPIVKDIKSNTSHAKFRKLVKYKFTRDKEITIKFGLFGNKTGGERTEASPWFKAYWSNYGTLTLRSSQHLFDNPIKKMSKNVKGGIKPRLFLEKSIEGKDQQIFNNFTKYLQEGADKLEENQK